MKDVAGFGYLQFKILAELESDINLRWISVYNTLDHTFDTHIFSLARLIYIILIRKLEWKYFSCIFGFALVAGF